MCERQITVPNNSILYCSERYASISSYHRLLSIHACFHVLFVLILNRYYTLSTTIPAPSQLYINRVSHPLSHPTPY